MGIVLVIRHHELDLPVVALFYLGSGDAELQEVLAECGEVAGRCPPIRWAPQRGTAELTEPEGEETADDDAAGGLPDAAEDVAVGEAEAKRGAANDLGASNFTGLASA